MVKDKNLFTLEKEILLIQLVQSRPILWDPTIEEYKRADKKRGKWDEIVAAMGPGYTVDNIMARWKSMRETWQDNLNRVNESKRKCSGNGPEDMYRPRWKLWEPLQYLKKACVVTESVSNINSKSQESFIDSPSTSSHSNSSLTLDGANILSNVYYDVDQKKYMMIPPDTQPHQSSEAGEIGSEIVYVEKASSSAVPFSLSTPKTSSSSEELYLKRGGNKRKAGAIMDEAVKILKDLSNEPQVPVAITDAADHFGSFVAARLRTMEPTGRKQCEDQLMTVLMKF